LEKIIFYVMILILMGEVCYLLSWDVTILIDKR
jgi:hypothetical protein